MEGAKVALVQFHVSPPKSDMDMNIVVSDYTQMDRILREERNYILRLVKQIKATGCNVLLIQKSILRCTPRTVLLCGGCTRVYRGADVASGPGHNMLLPVSGQGALGDWL